MGMFSRRETERPLPVALLATLRRDVIPDPAAIAAEEVKETRAVEDIAAAFEADWERVDAAGDPNAYLRLKPQAERLADLRERLKAFPPAKQKAERQQLAFLKLAVLADQMGDDVQGQLDALLDHPPADDKARIAALRQLEDTARGWTRLVWVLQRVSNAAQFKEPVDVLHVVRSTLEDRIAEIDRLRVPGQKGRYVTPPEIAALIGALEGREVQETEHANVSAV